MKAIAIAIAGLALVGGVVYGAMHLHRSGMLPSSTKGTVKVGDDVWTWEVYPDSGQFWAKVRTPSMGGKFPRVETVGPFATSDDAKNGAVKWINEDAAQAAA